MKNCNKCKIDKDFSNFYIDKRRETYTATCKICIKEKANLYYKNNPEKVKKQSHDYYQNNKEICYKKNLVYQKSHPEMGRNTTLKRKYGITLVEYNKILLYQDNRCATCKQYETVKDPRNNKLKDLAVDHNHKTGKVRGLLCDSCNLSIGRTKENIKTLKNMIEYLEYHNLNDVDNLKDL